MEAVRRGNGRGTIEKLAFEVDIHTNNAGKGLVRAVEEEKKDFGC